MFFNQFNMKFKMKFVEYIKKNPELHSPEGLHMYLFKFLILIFFYFIFFFYMVYDFLIYNL